MPIKIWRQKIVKKVFIYCQLVAKFIGLIFALFSVFVFIWQFLPLYTGKGVIYIIFIIGGFIWGLDILWSTIEDTKTIDKEIKNI